MTRITAEYLWTTHRAALGGDAAKSGADGRPLNLPRQLGDCPPGVQMAHWAMAYAACFAVGDDEPPIPPGVTLEMAERARQLCVTRGIEF